MCYPICEIRIPVGSRGKALMLWRRDFLRRFARREVRDLPERLFELTVRLPTAPPISGRRFGPKISKATNATTTSSVQ